MEAVRDARPTRIGGAQLDGDPGGTEVDASYTAQVLQDSTE